MSVITGALIRTASSGARYEIDADGIRRYNAEGQQVDLQSGLVVVADE